MINIEAYERFIMINETLKLKAGKYLIPVNVSTENNRIWLQFRYNQSLLDEVRVMKGAKWHGYDKPPIKQWSVEDCPRNRFRLTYLAHPGLKDPLNPYIHYDRELEEMRAPSRLLYKHQVRLFHHGLQRKRCVFAAEMGTGKTLAAIEVMEASGVDDWWWIAPRSALYSVQLEFDKWNSRIRPRFYTYEALKKLLENWEPGRPPPQGIVGDEISRCKNPTAQRTQAVQYLADQMRTTFGDDCYVILMSGTPAPKSPADWWSICEIACPGFLKEGSIDKFRKRLAVIEMSEAPHGGVFPRLITWKDSSFKCDECGQSRDSDCHDPKNMVEEGYFHQFKPAENEVSKLYQRMKGLVEVIFKKDCLDLPEKQYRVIKLPVSQSMMNLARLIQAKASTSVQALTLLRELSDGFQYEQVETGATELCGNCKGKGESIGYFDGDRQLLPDEIQEVLVSGEDLHSLARPITCPTCSGLRIVPVMARQSQEVACPKYDALKDILDEHEEVGRIVIYGGFTGTVDRIIKTCLEEKWEFIRADGRGWLSSFHQMPPMEMLKVFQNVGENHPRVAFVGQPSAAGMGLNLTASPTILYVSNDFNAESRIQSEDRIHRPGMDVNRGATIIDLIHLPTDELVMLNLQKKRQLQNMSMGELGDALKIQDFVINRDALV